MKKQLFSYAEITKMDTKHNPKNLEFDTYNYDHCYENEESPDTNTKSNKEESADSPSMPPLAISNIYIITDVIYQNSSLGNEESACQEQARHMQLLYSPFFSV